MIVDMFSKWLEVFPSSKQDADAVGRENDTIKAKLGKCCNETGHSWFKALVLFHMGMQVRKYGLSLFEILFGRSPDRCRSNQTPTANLSTTLRALLCTGKECTAIWSHSSAPQPETKCQGSYQGPQIFLSRTQRQYQGPNHQDSS